MSGRRLTSEEMRAMRREVRTSAAGMSALSVSGIVTGDLHSSRPYSFTVRIGCIVRRESFATEHEAVLAHATAVADLITLGSRSA